MTVVDAARPVPAVAVLSTAAAETHPQSHAACSSPSPAGVVLPPWPASHQLSAAVQAVSGAPLPYASEHHFTSNTRYQFGDSMQQAA